MSAPEALPPSCPSPQPFAHPALPPLRRVSVRETCATPARSHLRECPTASPSAERMSNARRDLESSTTRRPSAWRSGVSLDLTLHLFPRSISPVGKQKNSALWLQVFQAPSCQIFSQNCPGHALAAGLRHELPVR